MMRSIGWSAPCSRRSPHDRTVNVTTAPLVGTASRSRSRSGDIVGYDVLRAVAALGIVFIHLYQLFLLRGVDALAWARSGDAGVPIFFVLSGFLIATSILRSSSFDRRSYGLRRAARILPLYYLVLVIAFVFVDPTPMLTGTGQSDVLAHVFFLHGLFRSTRYTINGVLWTLTTEVLFYALMAVLAPLFRHRTAGWAVAGTMVVIGPAWRWVVWSPNVEDAAYAVQQLPGMADLFGVGMLLALLLRQGWAERLLRRGLVRLVLVVATVAWLVPISLSYHRRHAEYWTSHRYVTLWPLLFAVGIAGLILCLRAQ